MILSNLTMLNPSILVNWMRLSQPVDTSMFAAGCRLDSTGRTSEESGHSH